MIKTMTRMMAATAALGLVAAPIVAQANTRAGDSTAVYSVGNSAPGLGRADDGEDLVAKKSGGLIYVFLAGTTFLLGIFVATDVLGDDDGNCASPGTC